MLHTIIAGLENQTAAWGCAALIAAVLTFLAWIANYAAKCAQAKCRYLVRAAGPSSVRKPVQGNLLVWRKVVRR